ncbi:sigma 54-interacting transcriptional regulator [Oceanobacillus rekensis]|uniref:sigma 54-interacting transcriptional regulator n=1 Tax=Oceanobacillus rekensis TaxID=937927 RepID=UPI000B4375CC|nr:sigma 54-interacting transcriptional regulator [Oceanobacillus rekensis]
MMEKVQVGNWMNRHVTSINQLMSIEDALQLLEELNKTELPVTEDGCFIGVFRLHACIQKVRDGLSFENPVQFVMDRTCTSINQNDQMKDVAHVPSYIIQGEERLLVGELTEKELLAYHQDLHSVLEKAEELVKWYELVFDTAYEGLTVVDENGVIQLFNQAYSRYVGVSREKAIGHHAEEIIDNTRLPVVLKTGVPERSQAHRLQGQNLVVHRIPIWKDNEVIGAAGILIYEGMSEIYQVIQQMEKLEEKRSQSEFKLPSPDFYPDNRTQFENILGNSPIISETKKMARKAARSKATILLTGESGVGKEQFAKAIHYGSEAGKGNFVSVNCAAIPDGLLESELFGYSKGAYTGADMNGKQGKFELAHGGTLFLDEIGDMPLSMQAKILRVLQERKVERVGGNRQIPVDFRLITATNKDLKQMVAAGEFREDLYYRLYVIPIKIPPLRERKEDIPIILSHRIQQLAEIYGGKLKTIDQRILQMMNQYDWPGNVRELMNVLERLFVLSDSDHITIDNLPEILLSEVHNRQTIVGRIQRKNNTLKDEFRDERQSIELTLKQAKGNKTEAAKLLGISRATLYNKLSRLAID